MEGSSGAAQRDRLGLAPSPGAILAATLGLAVLFAVLSLYLVTREPHLGLTLGPTDDGRVQIVASTQESVPAGTRLETLAASGRDPVALRADDILEEPDTLASYDEVNVFRARQSALAAITAMASVTLTGTTATGEALVADIVPAPGRPLATLPVEYWLQLFVGIGGLLIGAWVWALRRSDPSAAFLFLTGLGLMISALSASVYSVRELAIPAELFRLLSAGNYIGTNAFGVALICLFLVYPRRLVPHGALWGLWALLVALCIGHIGQFFPSQSLGAYGPMLVMFFLIAGLVGLQTFLARADPLARAALGWFGLSILCGTGVFVFAIAAPVLLGLEPQLSQAQGFGILLLIYAGLALGIARYRLFDLGTWAFRLGSYLLGALILIGLDAILVYGVAIERVPAFGIALLLVAIIYLPLRNMLGHRLWPAETVTHGRFREIVDIALARSRAEQSRRWRALIEAAFRPLAIETATGEGPASLVEEGLGLFVPGHGPVPALLLRHAAAGRRLFSMRDVERARDLHELLVHALESRDAHEQGVRQERRRIARDLHDNIGAQLMRSIQTADPARKDALLGETLTDLRDIISNARGLGMALEEVLAELRYETDERLVAAGLTLDWHATCDSTATISARFAHTLRSLVREAASNAIRHSEGSRLSVLVDQDENGLSLTIADDGRGFDSAATAPGSGLGNMRARVNDHAGTLLLASNAGTRIEIRFPNAETAS
ncbi:sensor histidine kinase [Arsenicitalea aurantiaca]|nr:ATP-binding protein [Arsenicitalea aurantiaca]